MRIRIIAILFLVFISSQSNKVFSQKEDIPAYIVLKGSSDTIYKKLIVRRLGSYKKGMKPSTVIGKKLEFKKKNGGTEKIKVEELNRLEFTDFHDIKRIFINESQVGLPDKKHDLVEIVHEGTISLYRRYFVASPDMYTGTVYIPGDAQTGLVSERYQPASFGGSLPYNVMGDDFFIYDGYPGKYINLYQKRGKRELIEMMPDRPDLHDRVMNVQNYKELVQILIDYDTDPEIVAKRIKQNSPKEKSNILKILNSVDSVNTRKVEDAGELKAGDFIKYVGPGTDKIGMVKKVLSSSVILMTYDLDSDPKEFKVRVSDVELIIN